MLSIEARWFLRILTKISCTFPVLALTTLTSMILVERAQGSELEAYFNSPVVKFGIVRKSQIIQKKVIDLVERSVSGSKIRASIYQIDDGKLVDAFLRARKRGVDIRIVMDHKVLEEKQYTSEAMRLVDEDGIQVHICQLNSCIGTPGTTNHNKFYLFSRLKKSPDDQFVENVVVQTSQNPTGNQNNNFNDMLVSGGNQVLYNGYFQYWTDLRNENRNPDYMSGPAGIVSGNSFSKTRVFFTPSKTIDPLVELLSKVDCSEGGIIFLAQMSFQYDDRGKNVVKELLKHKNCEIKVIVRKDKAKEVISVLDPHLGPDFKIYTFSKTPLRPNTHTKLAIVQDKNMRVIMTGTANLSDSNLRTKDNVIIQTENENIFDKYLVFFHEMKRMASKRK